MYFSLQVHALFDIRTSKSAPNMRCFVHFDFIMCFSPQRRAIFRHQNFKKCSNHEVFFNIFTSKCASRHSGVHSFDIRTSKSGLNMRCFSPQRRAIFRHQNFKKCSEHEVFCTFWLQNVLPTWLLYSAFQLSILSEVCYLNFLRWDGSEWCW